MFIARNLTKFSEEDIYADGCQPETTQSFEINETWTGKTPAEVIEKIAAFLGVDEDGIEKNACEEKGRVDFAKTENAEGYTISKRELADWKRGKVKAWYCVYTTYIEKCEPVQL